MRILFLFFTLGLQACEPKLDSSSTYEEVVETLTDNYYDNQDEFNQIIAFYQENWVPGIERKFNCVGYGEDLTTTEYYQKEYSDEDKEWYLKSREVCALQDSAKMFYWNRSDNRWIFYTFEARNDGYLVKYVYVFSKEKINAEDICEDTDPKEGKEQGSCMIPLKANWYINYYYGRIPQEFLEKYKSR